MKTGKSLKSHVLHDTSVHSRPKLQLWRIWFWKKYTHL